MQAATLIKHVELYAPEHQGKQDILLFNGKIVRIAPHIGQQKVVSLFPDVEIYDAKDLIAVPGIVDIHAHFNGAGGEGAPQFRTPPTQLSELTTAGITTAVGLLGTDGITRSLNDLYMKARALENEGISTYIYTGSYQIPSPTFTDNISLDLSIIDKVVGLKIAFSDHRCSHPDDNSFAQVVSAARVGGIIGGKSGKVMIHMGTPVNGLERIREILAQTAIPLSQVIPTHLNRSEEVFNAAIQYALTGGNVDVSAGVSEKYYFPGAVKPSAAVARLLAAGVPLNRITMSSDGNGVMTVFNEDGTTTMLVSPVKAMLEEFRDMVLEGVVISDAVQVVATNPANLLSLTGKGKLREGLDADILLLSKDMQLKAVFARGQKMVDDGRVLVKGVFEV